MSRGHGEKIVLLGMMSKMPVAGVMWLMAQYMVGFKRLGYDQKQINEIIQYIDENDTIEGAPHLLESHLTVFDCAFKPAHGTRSIHYQGHLRMMGAVQPFISGAISKTINMPPSATVEEIEQAYYEAWRLGLKAVAVYRDGCKRSQPLSTAREKMAEEPAQHIMHRTWGFSARSRASRSTSSPRSSRASSRSAARRNRPIPTAARASRLSSRCEVYRRPAR